MVKKHDTVLNMVEIKRKEDDLLTSKVPKPSSTNKNAFQC